MQKPLALIILLVQESARGWTLLGSQPQTEAIWIWNQGRESQEPRHFPEEGFLSNGTNSLLAFLCRQQGSPAGHPGCSPWEEMGRGHTQGNVPLLIYSRLSLSQFSDSSCPCREGPVCQGKLFTQEIGSKWASEKNSNAINDSISSPFCD